MGGIVRFRNVELMARKGPFRSHQRVGEIS